MIHILLTNLSTFSYSSSWENYSKDQSNSPLVAISSSLIFSQRTNTQNTERSMQSWNVKMGSILLPNRLLKVFRADFASFSIINAPSLPRNNVVSRFPVVFTYPGFPVSSYPGLHTHLNDSGKSTHSCIVKLQLCRPLRHSFSRGHRVEAHTLVTWLDTFLPSHVSCKGPLRGEQCSLCQ